MTCLMGTTERSVFPHNQYRCRNTTLSTSQRTMKSREGSGLLGPPSTEVEKSGMQAWLAPGPCLICTEACQGRRDTGSQPRQDGCQVPDRNSHR